MTAGKYTPKFESNLPIPNAKIKRALSWASAAAQNAGGISAGAPYHNYTEKNVTNYPKSFFCTLRIRFVCNCLLFFFLLFP